MTNDILSQITARKREEIARQKSARPIALLRDQAKTVSRPCLSMKRALERSSTGIIAEFKRRSPSKGWISQKADAAQIPSAYEQAGAAALSILTDSEFFGGSMGDLQTARTVTSLPLLCKEFIIDEYQLLQARLAGADAVLLIAACLSKETCAVLADLAHRLGLEVLLELHAPQELTYVECQADMVGINNRHLGSFHTDAGTSFRMAEALRQSVSQLPGYAPVLVSESGLSDTATVRKLREAGFRGFLIGETFMRTEHPARTLQTFVTELNHTPRL